MTLKPDEIEAALDAVDEQLEFGDHGFTKSQLQTIRKALELAQQMQEQEKLDENGLKPCPFCGSNDIDPEGVTSFKKEYRDKEGVSWSHYTEKMLEHRPSCNNCGATTEDNWNNRAKEMNDG